MSAVVRYLGDVLSPDLTVAMAGVRDVKVVDPWADGARLQPRTEKRLRDANRVAQVLMQAESPEAVRS